MKFALIVVDLQVDFCEDGALAVPGGNRVAEDIDHFINEEGWAYDEIIFTKDWHEAPPSTNGGHFGDPPDYVDTWPVHCVQFSKGAEFHPAIRNQTYKWPLQNIFYKGDGRPDYSGFQGYNYLGDTLGDFLFNQGITNVDVAGLAGDYCVRETALDAARRGYYTTVLPNLTASVGGEKATAETVRMLCKF